MLDLTQLPAEVWPDGNLPAGLASSVQPLFSTDFYREKWCLDVDGSRIEIALDLGDVKAGEFAEPICELELELLRGDTRAVLKLAKQLLSQTGLRQGSLSKAARGYHLAQGNAPRENTPTAILRTAAKATVEQGWRSRWIWRCHSGSTMKSSGCAATSRRKNMCWMLWD